MCGYAISAANPAGLDTMIPCRKGDPILVYYSASGSLANFRFIYAEGEPYNPVSSSGDSSGGQGGGGDWDV